MKSISRRIRRLEEERFGTAAGIEFGRRLHERIEEAQRILAEARERDGCGSIGDDYREDLRGLSFDEIIQRERERLVYENGQQADRPA